MNNMYSDPDYKRLVRLIDLSRAHSYDKGARAKYVAEWFIREQPQYAGYRNRLYDWALHTIVKNSYIPLPWWK